MMETLLELLQGIEQSFGIRICVHDVSGMTSASRMLALPYEWMSHECAFCHQVKALGGEHRCIQQKEATMRMLRRNGLQAFSGMCRMGISEAIRPVVRDGALLAVVYASAVTQETAAQAKQRMQAEAELRLPGGSALLSPAFDQLAAHPVTQAQLCFFADLVCRFMLLDAAASVAPLPEVNRFPAEAIRITRKGILPAVLNHLAVHFRERISIARLAHLFYISEAHLCRLFRAEMGMTISAYIKRLRVRAARRELEETALPIALISEHVGYDDPNYFCRVFAQLTGMTPSRYRSLHR